MEKTQEDCLESLKEAKRELGETPSKRQYEELGLTPAHSTILRKFDSWNDAKDKAGLKKLDENSRNTSPIKPKPDDVEIPEDKDWEELTSQQRFYRKNKDEFRKKEIERRQQNLEWFYNYKKQNCSCERCGEEHPATLDFHHVGEKKLGISKMVRRKHSIENIKEEMEKCIVLCANCHRKEHYEKPV